MQEKEIFNGTNGALWITTDDEEIQVGEIQSFVMTQTNEYEEFSKAGEYGKYQKFLGFSLAGTISKYKINNKMLNIIYQYSLGESPAISIIGKVENPNTGSMQRIKFSNVTLDSLDLINFEQKVATKEEIPIKAAKYTFLDND